MDTIDRLTADDFAPYVGKRFHPDGTDFELTLVRIDQPGFPGWAATMRKPFSLILCGPHGRVLPEGMYRIVIEGGPSLALYMMPIFTLSRDHQDYQIAFN
ncbi:MAG: DUF6916 family protein [Stellaceae bacterium]